MADKTTTTPDELTEQLPKKRPWWKRVLRLLGRTLLFVVALLVVLILVIRSPWGQNFIIDKVTNYVSDKTHTEVAIDKLFITFSGDVELRGLYLEDTKGDTLLYSDVLQAGIPIWPIIKGQPIAINNVEWSGLRANVARQDSVHGFNFQFLIDAFSTDSSAPADTTTSSNPLEIAIGEIDFHDFHLRYKDAVLGIDSELYLGNLHLEGETLDLENMRYGLTDLELKNTHVYYVQTKAFPLSEEEDSTATALPFLSVEQLKLHHVAVYYKSVPDGIEAEANIGDFLLELPKADLTQQEIAITQIGLHKSNISVEMTTDSTTAVPSETPTVATTQPAEFTWPEWQVALGEIEMTKNSLRYQNGPKPVESAGFNPDYIAIDNLVLKASDIELSKQETLKASVEALSFTQENGIDLQQLNFKLALEAQQLALKQLVIQTAHSELAITAEVSYPSLNTLVNHPDYSKFKLTAPHFSLDLADAFLFLPELATNDYLMKLSQHKITGNLGVSGSLSKLKLTDFSLHWGAQTTLIAQGDFVEATDLEKFQFDLTQFNFQTNRSVMSQFVATDSLGLTLPETVHFTSTARGGLDDMVADLNVILPQGKINVVGEFKNAEQLAVDATMKIQNLALGELLQIPEIGNLGMQMNLSAKGNSLDDVSAQLKTRFDKLELYGYDYAALTIDGAVKKGEGTLNMTIDDYNLNLLVNSKIKLDSLAQNISFNVDMNGIDLYNLGLMKRKMKAGLHLVGQLKMDTTGLDVTTHITKGVVVYDDDTYNLGEVKLSAMLHQDSTAAKISSDFLKANVQSNATLSGITKALGRQLRHYFVDSIDSTNPLGRNHQPVHLAMDAQFSPNRFMKKIFLTDVKQMDTLRFSLDFDQKKEQLQADLWLSSLNYADNTIDNLQFEIAASHDAAQFNVGFDDLDAGAFTMNRTFVDGDLKQGKLTVNFNALDSIGGELYTVQTLLWAKHKKLMIQTNSDHLILNGEAWQMPQDNLLTISEDSIVAQNVKMSHGDQRLQVANDLMKVRSTNVGVSFENFKLATFLALFNAQDHLASGLLQGEIVALNPMENVGVLANFGIDNLKVMNADLGNFIFKAYAGGLNEYYFKTSLLGDQVDIKSQGKYVAKQDKKPQLHLELNLNKFGLQPLAELSGNSLSGASGYISGEFEVNNDKAKGVNYDGFIQFNQAAFTVTMLNSKFYLDHDRIEIDNSGLRFNQFSVLDAHKHPFVIDGEVKTPRGESPQFDLTLDATDFQLMNTEQSEDLPFYGRIDLDVTGGITGTMNFPEVNMAIGVNGDTDFTYVMSETQAAIEKQEGVVEFVNKANPDAILTRQSDSLNKAEISGIQLHAELDIDKAATFGVIVDPRSGDNLQISGQGDLDFRITRTGHMSMTGRYVVSGGHYKMSLYSLVKREFDFKPGSTVVWRGDPMDAQLDVTATYDVKTSASALMAAAISGASSQEKFKYQQRLPFIVSMNVKGTIERPELSFDLTMPEDSKGAIGGAVYARLKQLNQNKGAVSKQVFSLLVFNRFFPEAGSDGSQGGVATIARDNLAQALSDQLNNFSNKLMGNTGIQLNFGVESYTDYQGQSAQTRTDLNISAQKSLFNDRLIVKAGTEMNVQGDLRPGETNPLLGNVSIEYLLTKDGRWRLRGFRKNEYENIIDGQVFVNGIGVQFQRQFNQFSQLWQSFFGNPNKEKPTSDNNDNSEEIPNDKGHSSEQEQRETQKTTH